ncbi:monofunctional biosynthetic peptidoglycan transglycosylase [Prosthecomicrobium sp. N25]|uniref:monofunctional biosynthetic peptidoglycan transglycosylase n=1 Tax=Prosthecomicrobium sp. N25 TaxID=3129254 RepID=UPI00307831AF
MRIWIRRVAWALVVLAAVPLGLTLLYRIVDPVSTLMLADQVRGRPVDRRWVPLDRISPEVVRAVVSSEDARFCSHHGIDWAEIDRAVDVSERTGRGPRGVSTLTMQVAKNLFLWPQRSWLRKILEAPLALWIDLVLPKRRVLEIYLNIAEWGPGGVYGIEAGAQRAFRKPASALGPREAAIMATALPNPILRDPSRPSRRHQGLASIIERRARAAGATLDCLKG